MTEVALFDAPEMADQSTKDEATERADRIRVGMIAVAGLPADIKAAWERQDWLALGYLSWDGYIHGEFGEHRLPMITREQRRNLVADLRSGGLSTRAIGSVLGVDPKTVRNDLSDAGGDFSPPADVDQNRATLGEIDGVLAIAPDRIVGADGKSYPAIRPIAASGDDVVDAEVVDDDADQLSVPKPEPKVMLSHEVAANPTRDTVADEENRRRLVATHLLCEVLPTLAQCRGTATFSRYDPTKALPGRAVTLDVLRNARAAADEAIAVWTERGWQ